MLAIEDAGDGDVTCDAAAADDHPHLEPRSAGEGQHLPSGEERPGNALNRVERIECQTGSFFPPGIHHFATALFIKADRDADETSREIDRPGDRSRSMEAAVIDDKFTRVVEVTVVIEIEIDHAPVIAVGAESVTAGAVFADIKPPLP